MHENLTSLNTPWLFRGEVRGFSLESYQGPESNRIHKPRRLEDGLRCQRWQELEFCAAVFSPIVRPSEPTPVALRMPPLCTGRLDTYLFAASLVYFVLCLSAIVCLLCPLTPPHPTPPPPVFSTLPFLIIFVGFQHHCRGCGQVYCSAHAPPTEVPPGDGTLKLCWSCVLEGAAPLPASLLEDEEDEFNQRTMMGLSPNTARGIAEDDTVSPTAAVVNLAASAAAAGGGAYAAAQPPSPLSRHGGGGDRFGARAGDDGRQEGGKKEGSGFLSALVSLIEVVASPTSPARPLHGRAAAGASKKPETKRPPALSVAGRINGDWRAGWSTPKGSVGTQSGTTGGDSSPLLLRKEYGSDSETRTQVLQPDVGEFPSPSPTSAGFRSVTGDDLVREGGGLGGVDSSSGGLENRNRVVERGALFDEKPVELGFPSERPWAHGFGS